MIREKTRYEPEILGKITFYDTEGITARLPLYVYRTIGETVETAKSDGMARFGSVMPSFFAA